MKVLKKGKIVFTKNRNFVINLADEIVKNINSYCNRIKIVGSIRRKEKNPVDIDIVLIPKDKLKIKNILKKKGVFISGGEKKSTFKIRGVKVELYYTITKEWGAALLAYSSKTGSSIGLRVVAKKKGFKLNQHGLFDRKTGKFNAGRTEEEIYKALGRPWKPPEKRWNFWKMYSQGRYIEETFRERYI